ncbi:TCRVB17-like protein [Camelus ferus]|nr:TCRVB17-like protein [Camelus ferus]
MRAVSNNDKDLTSPDLDEMGKHCKCRKCRICFRLILPVRPLLLLPFPGVRAQTIHQRPPTMVQPMGSSLSLECTVKGTSNPSLYWYRQAAGGALQLLFYSFSADQVDSEEPQNFEASVSQDGSFILSSKKLLLNNSGFYLCAWSLTLSRLGQASVQKPHPLRSPRRPLQEPWLRGWVKDDCHRVSDCQPM